MGSFLRDKFAQSTGFLGYFASLSTRNLRRRIASGRNPQMGVVMKTDPRYQNGSLYEHHGAWYVRYRQRISKEDGSSNLNHASKHLGRSKDFLNISDVELSRASFMQTVNRDRLSANSRITLTAFVEGAYLPWTKEERRASTSKGHYEIWVNHIRDHVGEIHLREFRTVDASRMLRAIAKENDLTKTTLQHIKSVLSTIFTYAKNEGAFDGANPVDGVLIPRHAKEPGETHESVEKSGQRQKLVLRRE
jgi:hypothetical protein